MCAAIVLSSVVFTPMVPRSFASRSGVAQHFGQDATHGFLHGQGNRFLDRRRHGVIQAFGQTIEDLVEAVNLRGQGFSDLAVRHRGHGKSSPVKGDKGFEDRRRPAVSLVFSLLRLSLTHALGWGSLTGKGKKR